MKQSFCRILAIAMGLYLAWGMSRTAMDLGQASEEAGRLQEACAQTEAEILSLEAERTMSEADLHQWAFRQNGMVSREDVVFFDGG